jgi:hypothetical protein
MHRLTWSYTVHIWHVKKQLYINVTLNRGNGLHEPSVFINHNSDLSWPVISLTSTVYSRLTLLEILLWQFKGVVNS